MRKVPLSALAQSVDALRRLSELPLDIVATFRLATMIQAVDQHLKTLHEVQQRKDAELAQAVSSSSKMQLPRPAADEMQALMESEVEIPDVWLYIKDLRNHPISAQTLLPVMSWLFNPEACQSVTMSEKVEPKKLARAFGGSDLNSLKAAETSKEDRSRDLPLHMDPEAD